MRYSLTRLALASTLSVAFSMPAFASLANPTAPITPTEVNPTTLSAPIVSFHLREVTLPALEIDMPYYFDLNTLVEITKGDLTPDDVMWAVTGMPRGFFFESDSAIVGSLLDPPTSPEITLSITIYALGMSASQDYTVEVKGLAL